MQTHEWEALLSGTTPRPWVIGTTLKDPLVDVSAGTYEDARLLAAAPAAVAEVVRLRRRLERMRENYEFIATHADHPQVLGVVHQINDYLTRLLEGDTNE